MDYRRVVLHLCVVGNFTASAFLRSAYLEKRFTRFSITTDEKKQKEKKISSKHEQLCFLCVS